MSDNQTISYTPIQQFGGVDRVVSYGTGYNYTLKSQTKSAAARLLSSIDKRARSARLSGLRINIRFLAALRAAYQANGADVGVSEQARSSLRRSSAAPLAIL